MIHEGLLRVGSVIVWDDLEHLDSELLAVFRDDMLQIRQVPSEQYGYDVEPDHGAYVDGTIVNVAEFRFRGRQVAERLDVMGFDSAHVLAAVDEVLQAEAAGLDEAFLAEYPDMRGEAELLGGMASRDWVARLADTPDDPEAIFDTKTLGSRGWLLDLIKDFDVRRRLRAVLLAFPDATVVLDATWWGENGWDDFEPASLASHAQQAVRQEVATHVPIIVLTEGKTDAEFLESALAVLYPHLTDLVRFLDYERRPEGGVSALARTVRAFAAAGIANRVIAVCDNDAAAADGLRGLNEADLPTHIRVMFYPDLDLARTYPTLGPPTKDNPAGSTDVADVNGLAASIELYLGRDVLTTNDGTLYPVQWKAFMPGIGRYQGEVTSKHEIHEAFRAKSTLALRDPSTVQNQDWDGLRLIIDALLSAFAGQLSNSRLGR